MNERVRDPYEMGRMLARFAELERETHALRAESKDTRAMMVRVESDVRALQTIVSSLADAAQELRALRPLRRAVTGLAVTAVLAVPAFLLAEGHRRAEADHVRDDVVAVKDAQQIAGRQIQSLGGDVRALSTELREWRVAQEREAQINEKRIDRLEERRRR